MELVTAIFVIAVLAWALVYAKHGSLVMGGVAFVTLGYVLTNHWHKFDLGFVSLNSGRLILLGLLLVFAWRWWKGEVKLSPLTTSECWGIALLGYITLRYLITPEATGEASTVAPGWKLAASYWMPALLYLVLRSANITLSRWKWLLGSLTVFGCYLALTGIAEVKGQWWAVFPRYISDPSLGTHFGRARGPALMSASLGVYLTVCFWAAWFLWAKVGRIGKLTLTATMCLMVVTLYYTYTRSCWLGLVCGLAIIPLVQFPRSWKPLIVGSMLVAGLVGLATVGGNLVDLGRKDSDASASHSVYQRASFLYLSKEMFKDYPIWGCGFGRFYDMKMPYLSDRRQQIELESLRQLDHHNTFLSVLVETGIVGFTLFVGLLASWARASWKLFRNSRAEKWMQAHGLFSFAVIMTYVVNGAFHDLTLSPSEQWLLCLAVGLVAQMQAMVTTSAEAAQTAISTNSVSKFPAPNYGLN